MSHLELKTRQRAEREGYPPNLALRVHRALSWLGRAEQDDADLDGQFIFLWIAFNAAYATQIDERFRLSEQETFRAFLEKLVGLDAGRRIEGLVWNEFTSGIRLLLDNPYVSEDFWSYKNGTMDEDEWQRRFAGSKRAAQTALARRQTATVLAIVLGRIYTLRNQLMHGGATWNSSVNRDQIRDCTHFMLKLVPVVIEIMMDHPKTLWGDPCYPVVDSRPIGARG
jgi:hypothetical protein